MATVEHGFLLLADLTGYTSYLAQGELAHAPVIAGDLLETIVGRLEPPFRLAKLEGDAAFLFVEDGRADPSLLVDAVEASYLAFRRRLRSIDAATACECTACALAPRLDLKLFVHHGPYLRSTIAGRDELAGPEVIVVHRLLKGRAATLDRGHGFALFTAAATAALGLDPTAPTLEAGRETIEHLGEIATYTLDLEQRWVSDSARRALDGGAEGGRILLDVRLETTASPAVAWALLTSPGERPRWEGPIAISERTADGRRGVGTQSRCVTGRLATIEDVVDWQPFEHLGRRLAITGLGRVDETIDLDATPPGLGVRVRWVAPAGGPVDRAAEVVVVAERRAALERLREVLAEDPSPADLAV